MGHSHAGHGHSHGIAGDADRSKLWIALWLLLGFMAFEVAAGIVAESLALLSDAAHMLTDAAAIASGVAKFAKRQGGRVAVGSGVAVAKAARFASPTDL